MTQNFGKNTSWPKREKEKLERVKSIKKLKDKGLNQSQISKELGISRQAVSKLIKEIK